MIRGLSALLAVFGSAFALASATPSAAAPPGSQCGVNLGAPQIAQAVRSVPPVAGLDAPWDPNPYGGNFDPCAALSTALVTVQGATGSSPEQALLFHNGEYVGPATPQAYPFTSLDTAGTNDGVVVLDYKDGRNVCTACQGPVHVVRYQWQFDRVWMLDPAPPSP
ncbi:MAG: hypothetical protein QOD90_4319 [Mycobacterium sp.]|jgi:hypothetical protein|nr:hypothetical protein [Mycobacterium sp.]